MSSIVTQVGIFQQPVGHKVVWNQRTINNVVVKPKDHSDILSIYSIFLCATVILALFFTVSLVLSLTTLYFLDWGSALLGMLGCIGLALVGWFSKRQIRS